LRVINIFINKLNAIKQQKASELKLVIKNSLNKSEQTQIILITFRDLKRSHPLVSKKKSELFA